MAWFLLQQVVIALAISQSNSSSDGRRREMRVVDDIVWVVQLSDLHFSVHHPERARDFQDIVGPTLAFVKPSLVLLTGDLTDGKSLDMLIMKQDEKEWLEYRMVMQNVVKRSGLDQSSFYDVRGNHDNFGVPVSNGSVDFFSKYSISAQIQRDPKVNSITIETNRRKILLVGLDTTLSSGLRGPTNLFGHPKDDLLYEIDSELSRVDSAAIPVTKVSFGHFPLSFSTASESGRSLIDVFIKNSLDAYLCGHLHTKFGKNLKSKKWGFWEWEMGDWRKSRAMRILAIDAGHISFSDIDFKSGTKSIIILPTFPLDSRFSSASQNYKCDASEPPSMNSIRALVFSASPISSVLAKIYDSSSGSHIVVFEAPMTKLASSQNSLFAAPWNIQDFEDPSPDRYLLEIVATDINGISVSSELRPFTVTGTPAKFPWSWKEFLMMGCQWDSLYYPLFWAFYILALPILLIPRLLISFSRRQFTYRSLNANESFISRTFRLSMELCNIPITWMGMTLYIFYLVLCPWFSGQTFSGDEDRLYMVYKGWVSGFNYMRKLQYIGSPDVMVVVLPHIYLVILPALVTMMALAAETGSYRNYLLSFSNKKNDDHDTTSDTKSIIQQRRRWLRKFLLAISLAICWKHYKSCVALMKAYEMNPVVHFPVYCFGIPSLLVYTIWRTCGC